MKFLYDFTILGGDIRQYYLAMHLKDLAYQVSMYGVPNPQNISDLNNDTIKPWMSLPDMINHSHVIAAPIPFSKDNKNLFISSDSENISITYLLKQLTPDQILLGGNIPPQVMEYCSLNNITCYDLMKIDSLASLNAIATAEGTIKEAIENSVINLSGSQSLVIGYGRCGGVLSGKLRGLSCNVTITDIDNLALLEASTMGYTTFPIDLLSNSIHKYDYIFNTAPAVTLTKDILLKISPYTTIIDIASVPGGADYEAANELDIQIRHCLGIPGKIAPKSSAEILAQEILNII